MVSPKYTMMPLDKHIDRGFGAIADSFMRAAEDLTRDDSETFSNAHLPINFLYRHAIELYLKSIIIVIHHSLNILYGTKSEPHILILRTGEWKSITSVHSITDLYNYFEYLVTQNEKAIAQIAQSNWKDIPLELKEAIAIVAQVDDSSTYFRYPSMRDVQSDNKKSSWKETNYIDNTKPSKLKNEPIKVFVEINDPDEIIRVYKFDYDPLGKIPEAIQTAAKLLEGAHLGLRVELAGGR